MEKSCKKCGKAQEPEADRTLCDECRTKRASVIKRYAIAIGVGVLAVLGTAAAVAQAASKRASAGELGDEQYDFDQDDEYDADDDDEYDDDDPYDSSLVNMGRAIDMLNGEEPYDADFVERWL